MGKKEKSRVSCHLQIIYDYILIDNLLIMVVIEFLFVTGKLLV